MSLSKKKEGTTLYQKRRKKNLVKNGKREKETFCSVGDSVATKNNGGIRKFSVA